MREFAPDREPRPCTRIIAANTAQANSGRRSVAAGQASASSSLELILKLAGSHAATAWPIVLSGVELKEF